MLTESAEMGKGYLSLAVGRRYLREGSRARGAYNACPAGRVIGVDGGKQRLAG